MTMTVRFAPSPTGYLHIGNIRTALFNALYAKKGKGRFILRLDDTDRERSKPHFADAIIEDLQWLGIDIAETERQSARLERYDDVAKILKASGRLYACYETTEELEYGRRRRLARGVPPVYDRSALKLSDEDHQHLQAEGQRPHWRFLLKNFDTDPFAPKRTEVIFHDQCRGMQTVDLAAVSDPVLIRQDGTYLYTLPSVVDDMDMDVTHVIRGEDHVSNTGVQIDLFRAIGATAPSFAHHNLLVGASGEGLSKRDGSLSIRSLREEGNEAIAVANVATLIGTSNSLQPYSDLQSLTEIFDLTNVSRAPARFDLADLHRINARLLHEMDFVSAEQRLRQIDVAGDETFWNAIRGNIACFDEAKMWWDVVSAPIDPKIAEEDRDFITMACNSLPDEPWDQTTWSAWTGHLKQETGRKGRALFLPLRRALTACDHGPELADLLPLIGRKNALDRLS